MSILTSSSSVGIVVEFNEYLLAAKLYPVVGKEQEL